MQRSGLSNKGSAPQAHSLRCRRWGLSHPGRQTEREKIPRPRELFLGQRHLCASPFTSQNPFTSQRELRRFHSESSIHSFRVHVAFDEGREAWVAKFG